ncbi:MAG: hypothetical protein AAGD92_07545 [Pseudomonadota bacterium]
MAKRILMVGWHPDAANYEKWPDLTAEKLTQGLEAQRNALAERGFEARWFLIRDADTGATLLADKLQQEDFDVVLIGAGVRRDEDHILLFEKLVNVIHEHAPRSHIAFNTNPFDTTAAVDRWL